MGLKGEGTVMKQKLLKLKQLGQWGGCDCAELYQQGTDEDKWYMNEEGMRLKEQRNLKMMYSSAEDINSQPRSGFSQLPTCLRCNIVACTSHIR